MSSGFTLVALAIAAATATFVLIIREIHIRALDMRVSKAVLGVPGQSAPFQDLTMRCNSNFFLPIALVALGGCAPVNTPVEETTPKQAAIFTSRETGTIMGDVRDIAQGVVTHETRPKFDAIERWEERGGFR